MPSVLNRSQTSLTTILCPGGPARPVPAPWVTRGRPPLPQVQLAETEAFSLNSDKSSSILLGDDLSLEDPTACPLRPKDSKVSGPVGSWTASLPCRLASAGSARTLLLPRAPFEQRLLWTRPSALVGQMRAAGLRGVERFTWSHTATRSARTPSSASSGLGCSLLPWILYPSKRTLCCPHGPQCPDGSEL